MSEQDRKILEIVRTALLMLVDAVERKLEIDRTAEIRKRLNAATFELNELKKGPCKTAEV